MKAKATKYPKLEVLNEKDIFVVKTNTDLTEGRGAEYTHALTETLATAVRMGRRAYVQGCDAPVEQAKMFYIAGHGWYAPATYVYTPTDEDKKEEIRIRNEQAKNILIEKFKNGEEITPEEREQILNMLAK